MLAPASNARSTSSRARHQLALVALSPDEDGLENVLQRLAKASLLEKRFDPGKGAFEYKAKAGARERAVGESFPKSVRAFRLNW